MAADADEKRIEYLEECLRKLRGVSASPGWMTEFVDRVLAGEDDPEPHVESNGAMIARLKEEAEA